MIFPLPLLRHEPYNVLMCIIMTLINEALRTPCKSLGHEANELSHVYEFARQLYLGARAMKGTGLSRLICVIQAPRDRMRV